MKAEDSMWKNWHLTSCVRLGWMDRLRVLCGTPIFVRFVSPDGACHAACAIETSVRRDWPPPPCRPGQANG